MPSERQRSNGLIASVQEHYADLLRFLARRMGDPDRAADVAHDTVLRLAAAGDAVAEVQDPRAYLFRVAGNLAIDTLRQNARRAAVAASDDAVEAVPDPAPLPDSTLLARERVRQLGAALDALPAKPRQALLLSRMDGMTHAQIAARLGVSESMVAKYIAQALRHCRDRLDPPNAGE
ncbi:RNA polymerase sigma factor [Azospirillum sp.]|uniref:RNA polymerase sigma factor n=1 Tax=Azospirillum sp. TaxID=34012 RepID=UPI003D734F99